MRLVSFRTGGPIRIGAVVGDKVVPLNAVLPPTEQVPDDMTAFLMAGDVAMAAARKAVDLYEHGKAKDAAIALKDADLQARLAARGITPRFHRLRMSPDSCS